VQCSAQICARDIAILYWLEQCAQTTHAPHGIYAVVNICVFTARCTLVQSTVIDIACRLSVCLSDCDVGGSRPHRLEILETNCTDNNYPNTFAFRSPKAIHQGNVGKFGENRGGVGKTGMLEHKSDNISETRKDR